MATNDKEYRDSEFEAAFRDEGSPAAGGETIGGIDAAVEEATEAAPDAALAAETAATPTGTPAAVVVVAEVDTDGKTEPNDQAAQAEAKRVNDENNAAASTNKSEAKTTGEQEAASQSGKDAPAKDTAAAATPAEGQADPVAAPPSAAAAEDDEPTDPKELQRKRSWEGRLRAEEARLKKIAEELEAKSGKPAAAAADDESQTQEQQAADAINAAAEQAQSSGDQGAADSLNAVAEQVESGELTAEEAMRVISEDFGDGFVKMIRALAADAAKTAVGERLGKIEQDTEGVMSHLHQDAQRKHYEAIANAHPDFVEVSEEPGFAEFVQANGLQQVVDAGSAQDINKVLSDYKQSKQAAASQAQEPAAKQAAAPTPAQDAVAAAQDEIDEESADAAEGVRSAGIKIPEKPQRADDDFVAAWKSF